MSRTLTRFRALPGAVECSPRASAEAQFTSSIVRSQRPSGSRPTQRSCQCTCHSPPAAQVILRRPAGSGPQRPPRAGVNLKRSPANRFLVVQRAETLPGAGANGGGGLIELATADVAVDQEVAGGAEGRLAPGGNQIFGKSFSAAGRRQLRKKWAPGQGRPLGGRPDGLHLASEQPLTRKAPATLAS